MNDPRRRLTLPEALTAVSFVLLLAALLVGVSWPR